MMKVFVVHEVGEFTEDGVTFCGIFASLDAVARFLADKLARDWFVPEDEPEAVTPHDEEFESDGYVFEVREVEVRGA